MRINVTGNAASGKTTLAARLGEELGLPVFSLDSIVWRPGWKLAPPEERLAAERALAASPRWIIDGVSPHVRSQADLVVYLDVPPHVCALRGVLRALRYFRRTRPGLPEPCPDIQIVPYLLGLIHRFPKRAGATIRREASTEAARFHVVPHPVQNERVLAHVRRWADAPRRAAMG